MIDIDAKIKRLEEADVKGYSNQILVDAFELSCRFLYTGNDTAFEREEKLRNYTTLLNELYRRMS